MTIIRARRGHGRAGGAPGRGRLALPALTVVAGLQLLRLMVTTVVSVYRDRLGALTGLALFAFLVVGLVPGRPAPAARPPARPGGERGRGGPGPAGRPAVRTRTPAGCWPRWGWSCSCGSCRSGWTGTAAGSGWRCWSGWPPTRPWPAWAAAGTTPGRSRPGRSPGRRAGRRRLAALAALPDPPGSPVDRGRGAGGWRTSCRWPGSRPALFPHALVWQNLGWQAVLGGRSPAQAFLLVMVGNLAALAAGTATAWPGRSAGRSPGPPSPGWPWPSPSGRRPRSPPAPRPGGHRRPAGGDRPPGHRAGGGDAGTAGQAEAVAAAWTAGMGLFVLLVFAYYAPATCPAGRQRAAPALAAALIGWPPCWPCRKCVESASDDR